MPLTPPDPKSKATSGKGTIFGIQVSITGGVPTYGAVAELKTLNFSGSKNDTEDVTNFDSASRFKEYVVTLADAGEVTISGNYIGADAGQTALRAGFTSGAILFFQITLPLQAAQVTSGETWTFQGFVQELDNGVEYSKTLSFSGKLKVTGPVTVVAGA